MSMPVDALAISRIIAEPTKRQNRPRLQIQSGGHIVFAAIQTIAFFRVTDLCLPVVCLNGSDNSKAKSERDRLTLIEGVGFCGDPVLDFKIIPRLEVGFRSPVTEIGRANWFAPPVTIKTGH
jgi:hypothetical protein